LTVTVSTGKTGTTGRLKQTNKQTNKQKTVTQINKTQNFSTFDGKINLTDFRISANTEKLK